MKRSFAHFSTLLMMLIMLPFHSVLAKDVESRQAFYEKNRREAYDNLYPEISYSLLKQAINAKQVFVIDANSEKTYLENHLPGAFSLANPEHLKANLPVLKEYPVVVYCYSKECNAWQRAADFAQAMGYKTIRHFKQGLKGWKSAEGSVENRSPK